MRPNDDELTDLWYDTMGTTGNPLGTLERTRIAGGVVVEVHRDTFLTGDARVDCYELTTHDADIPRDIPDRFGGDDDAVTGWWRIGFATFETAGAARHFVDARSNATIRERFLRDEVTEPC